MTGLPHAGWVVMTSAEVLVIGPALSDVALAQETLPASDVVRTAAWGAGFRSWTRSTRGGSSAGST